MLGGMALNDSVPETVIAFLATARTDLEASRGSAYESFSAVSCASQVVAGTNWFVKVQVSAAGACVHLRIYEDFGGNMQVHSTQLEDLTLDSPIEYF